MAYRRLTVVLPRREYQQLEALANREERTAVQQAIYLLRRALNPGTEANAGPTEQAAANV